MNIDEIHDYLMEHNEFSEITATNYAIELIGKSREEVDKYVKPVPDVRQEVNLTGIPTEVNQVNLTGIPIDNTQVDQVNLTGIPEPFNSLVSTKITKSLKTKIRQQADELGLPVSTLLRQVLKQYFK